MIAVRPTITENQRILFAPREEWDAVVDNESVPKHIRAIIKKVVKEDRANNQFATNTYIPMHASFAAILMEKLGYSP